MTLGNKEIKINKNMRKAELYDNCIKLLEVNHNLTGMIKHLEKRRHGDMIDLLSFSRSMMFLLNNFEPKSMIMECDEEDDSEIPIKKDKQELGVEIQ